MNQNHAKRELYLDIIDQFPNPIWRAGVDTKCDFFNKAWLEFTGRSIEEEMGDGWVSGVHKDDLEKCVATYLEAFKKREHFEMKYRLKHHDGTYHWLLDSGSPFFDVKGEFLGYIGSCYDINQEELSRLDESIESVALIAINDGVWDWDVPTGQAKFSKAYYGVLGYDVNEFEANYDNWMKLVHPDDKERVAKELEKHVKSADKFSIDLRMKSKSEEWLWVSTRGKVIENNSDGSAKRMVGVFTDISKQKLLEEKLQEKLREAEMLNELTVGRELKLVEMKERIKELEAKQH